MKVERKNWKDGRKKWKNGKMEGKRLEGWKEHIEQGRKGERESGGQGEGEERFRN